MIWFAWRQFRTQTWVALTALVAVGVTLAVTGPHLTGLWHDSGAAACRTDCDAPISAFLDAVGRDYTGVLYNSGTLLLYVAPALLGIFWGAPLVAREIEAGTHRLSWNQSVTRTRWLATKLALVGGASVAIIAVLSTVVGIWAHHVDDGDGIQPMLFGVRGVVPAAYAAFAFALGVTAGALVRRTVPAMAATLGVYVAAVAAMPLWIRAHLIPARHALVPLDTNHVSDLSISGNGSIQIVGDPHLAGWVLTNHTVTASGQPFTGPADPVACNDGTSMQNCLRWMDSLGLRSSVTYQPASRFWALQFAEAGLFLGLAVLLVAVCFRRLRRMS